MEYLTILIVLFLAAWFLQRTYKIRLYKTRAQCVRTVLALFVFQWIWDWIAFARGHWVFPGTHTLGIYIGIIPIEDYLLYLIGPYVVIVLYKLFSGQTGERGY